MAKVFIEESSLTAIGNAIREKTGESALLSPTDMVTAIGGITTGGGGGDLPEEAYTITGDCNYRFANDGWTWFLENYGSKVTTKDITNASYMFHSARGLKNIPFDIDFKDGGCDCDNLFFSCIKLESIPAINFKQTTYKKNGNLFYGDTGLKEIGTLSNLYPDGLAAMFSGCYNLRYLPEFENLNLDRVHSYQYSSLSSMFYNCYSLRSIPEELLKQLYNPLVTGYSTAFLYNSISYCFALDEVRGLNPQTGKISTNMFSSTFNFCYRLKDIIFATQEDGTPYSVNWSKQTIDLTKQTGYQESGVANTFSAINHNSGITIDKRIYDDATYAALKDDPDCFVAAAASTALYYSRYNHDSAVNTINSLPDVTQGSSNTIKFKGAAGSATDGGAINTLTEEEIAVAAAKGWTVTLV